MRGRIITSLCGTLAASTAAIAQVSDGRTFAGYGRAPSGEFEGFVATAPRRRGCWSCSARRCCPRAGAAAAVVEPRSNPSRS